MKTLHEVLYCSTLKLDAIHAIIFQENWNTSFTSLIMVAEIFLIPLKGVVSKRI